MDLTNEFDEKIFNEINVLICDVINSFELLYIMKVLHTQCYTLDDIGIIFFDESFEDAVFGKSMDTDKVRAVDLNPYRVSKKIIWIQFHVSVPIEPKSLKLGRVF